jgi:hypothetical protein
VVDSCWSSGACSWLSRFSELAHALAQPVDLLRQARFACASVDRLGVARKATIQLLPGRRASQATSNRGRRPTTSPQGGIRPLRVQTAGGVIAVLQIPLHELVCLVAGTG